jgi:hypothetical protein
LYVWAIAQELLTGKHKHIIEYRVDYLDLFT